MCGAALASWSAMVDHCWDVHARLGGHTVGFWGLARVAGEDFRDGSCKFLASGTEGDLENQESIISPLSTSQQNHTIAELVCQVKWICVQVPLWG